MTEKITLETRGHILLMGVNRPEKRNAFDVDMYHALALAYAQLENTHELRCGVLFAHGDHFTGGLDLAQWSPVMQADGFPTLPKNGFDPVGIIPPYRTKPIVIAVQGICLTIGIELALACDIRVAADNTRFGQIEIKRGIYPIGGATIRLPREVGWGNAMRYLLTADEFDAAEAHRIGMIQDVVPTGEQLNRAIEIAETIAQQAPLGVYATMASAFNAIDNEEDEKAHLIQRLRPILASEDAAEGVQSFIERRQADFKGK